jgi:hypothetical protein
MSSIAFPAASSNQEHVIRVAGATDSLPPMARERCAADARLRPRCTTALPVRRRSTRTRSTPNHTITHPPPRLTPPPRHRAVSCATLPRHSNLTPAAARRAPPTYDPHHRVHAQRLHPRPLVLAAALSPHEHHCSSPTIATQRLRSDAIPTPHLPNPRCSAPLTSTCWPPTRPQMDRSPSTSPAAGPQRRPLRDWVGSDDCYYAIHFYSICPLSFTLCIYILIKSLLLVSSLQFRDGRELQMIGDRDHFVCTSLFKSRDVKSSPVYGMRHE